MQYSLRTLLAITVAAAMATWVLFVLPDGIGLAVLSAMLSIFPGIVAAGIVYFRGYRQAFCIGMAPSQLPLMGFVWMLMMRLPYSNPYSFQYRGSADGLWIVKVYIAAALFVSVLAGLTGVLIYYIAQPKTEAAKQPKPALPHSATSRTAPIREEPVSTPPD